MLKPKEVCQKLGMSYRTLQSYVKKGYIKPVVQSGKWRFREDLEKLMGIVKKRKVALYARVSNKRKDDLVDQVKYLQQLWDFSLGIALKSRQNLMTAAR